MKTNMKRVQADLKRPRFFLWILQLHDHVFPFFSLHVPLSHTAKKFSLEKKGKGGLTKFNQILVVRIWFFSSCQSVDQTQSEKTGFEDD